MPTVLTIAGSDSSGGAGIQADLKTFAAHGVFGLSALTAVTAQNTQRVVLSVPLSPELVSAQIDAVLADFDVDATKIGMLGTEPIVRAVIDAIDRHALRHVVLDPVLAATTGLRLLDPAGFDLLREELLHRAAVVTPNLPEVEALLGRRVQGVEDMRAAAEALVAHGARAVVIKGGHLVGPPIDLVYEAGAFTELSGERIDARDTHGTGCTFSAALTARLALGDTLLAAARAAKTYVARGIERAPGLGHGRGPLWH